MDVSPIPQYSAFVPPQNPAPPKSTPTRDLGPAGSAVGVEYVRRDHGVQVMRFVDEATGMVLYQNPPEQVLSMVAEVIAAIDRRERANGR